MTDRIVTTSEVGSWMQDLGDHFSEIIEDRSGRQVRPPAVDENGVKWTYERITDVTGIPERTVERMVRKSRSGSPTARPTEHDLAREQRGVQSLARKDPKALAASIAAAPPAQRQAVIDALTEDPEAGKAVTKAVDHRRASGLPDPGYQRPKPAPEPGTLSGMANELEVGTLIRKARFAIRDAIELATEATYDEAVESLLLEDLGRLRAGTDHLESAITSTDTDIDAALADLLKGDE